MATPAPDWSRCRRVDSPRLVQAPPRRRDSSCRRSLLQLQGSTRPGDPIGVGTRSARAGAQAGRLPHAPALVLHAVPAALRGCRIRHPVSSFDIAAALVPADQVLPGGLPRAGILAIDAARFVAPERAGSLKNRDPVVGLRHRNSARAHPIAVLNWHEGANRTLEVMPARSPLRLAEPASSESG